MNILLDYIEKQNVSDKDSEIIFQTDLLIRSLIPQVRLVKKFHLPFYDYYKWMSFIQVRKNGVELGFIYGNQFDTSHGLFQNAHLKQVRHVYIDSLKLMEDERLLHIIIEAAQWNEQFRKK